METQLMIFLLGIPLLGMMVLVFWNIRQFRIITDRLLLLNSFQQKEKSNEKEVTAHAFLGENAKDTTTAIEKEIALEDLEDEKLTEEELELLNESLESLPTEEEAKEMKRLLAVKRATETKEFEKSHFQKKLFDQFPSLNYVELELCYLLWIGDSIVNISNSLSLSNGTLRVYKHKLRRKFELGKNANLELFLGSIVSFKPSIKKSKKL